MEIGIVRNGDIDLGLFCVVSFPRLGLQGKKQRKEVRWSRGEKKRASREI